MLRSVQCTVELLSKFWPYAADHAECSGSDTGQTAILCSEHVYSEQKQRHTVTLSLKDHRLLIESILFRFNMRCLA